jgi:hypothetical protein
MMRLLQEVKPYLAWSFAPVLIILAGHVLFQLQGGHLGPLIAITMASMFVLIGFSVVRYYRSKHGTLDQLAVPRAEMQSFELMKKRVEAQQREIESIILQMESTHEKQIKWPSELYGFKVSIDKREGREFVFIYDVVAKTSVLDILTSPLKEYFHLLVGMHRNDAEDNSRHRLFE